MSTLILVKQLLDNVKTSDEVSALLLSSAKALLDGELSAKKAEEKPQEKKSSKGDGADFDLHEWLKELEKAKEKPYGPHGPPYDTGPWPYRGPWLKDYPIGEPYILYSTGTSLTEAARKVLESLRGKRKEG